MSFLICLQFWRGDKMQAMRLARLIADLEPRPRTDVEFVFVARYDCDHDHETVSHVAKKFRTTWITTHTKWTGWPGGCNAMAKDTLEWAAANRKEANGVLMIEPDCVPTMRGWLNLIISEWNSLNGLVWQMGAWRNSGGEHGHINGNSVLMIEPAIPDVITEHLAWDCEIAPWIRHRWHITPLIKNCFDSKNATAKDLFWTPVGYPAAALVHGYKDDSAYNLVVQHLLNPDTEELSY